MKKFVRTVLSLALVAALVAPALAQDKKKKKRKKRPDRRGAALRLLPRAVQETLTADQKKKIAAIQKEYQPKFAAIGKKQREIITPEKQKAAREAITKARKDGKKGRELFQIYQNALGLDEAARKKLTGIRTEQRKLFTAYRTAIVNELTDEQKAKLRPVRKKGKKKKGKKKDAA